MVSIIWDICDVEDEFFLLLEEKNDRYIRKESFHDTGGIDVALCTDPINIMKERNAPGIDGLHNSLVDAQNTCQSFIDELDEALQLINEISLTYENVSHKTNALIMNCEDLLEQQVSILQF